MMELNNQKAQYQTAFDTYNNELRNINKNKKKVVEDEIENLAAEDQRQDREVKKEEERLEKESREAQKKAEPVVVSEKESTVVPEETAEETTEEEKKPTSTKDMSNEEILAAIHQRYVVTKDNGEIITAPFMAKEIKPFIVSMNNPKIGANFKEAEKYTVQEFMNDLFRELTAEPAMANAVKTMLDITLKDLHESIVNEAEAEIVTADPVIIEKFTPDRKGDQFLESDNMINQEEEYVEEGITAVSHDKIMYLINKEGEVRIEGQWMSQEEALKKYPAFHKDVETGQWYVLRDINGEPMESGMKSNVNSAALNNPKYFRTGSTIYFRVDTADEFNQGLSEEERATKVKIEIYQRDENGAIIVGGYIPGTENEQLREEMAQEWTENLDQPYIVNEEKWTSVIVDKLPGRIWNIDAQNWVDDTQEGRFYLGIGRSESNGEPFLDVPNAPENMTIPRENVTDGAVYLMVESANGRYIPVRLFTHKLSEVPVKQELAHNIIREVNEENWMKKAQQIKKHVYVDFRYENGQFVIYDHFKEDGVRKTMKKVRDIDGMLEHIDDLIVNVQLKSINRTLDDIDYNKQLSEDHAVSTDINPQQNFHSSKFIYKEYDGKPETVPGPERQATKEIPTVDDFGLAMPIQLFSEIDSALTQFAPGADEEVEEETTVPTEEIIYLSDLSQEAVSTKSKNTAYRIEKTGSTTGLLYVDAGLSDAFLIADKDIFLQPVADLTQTGFSNDLEFTQHEPAKVSLVNGKWTITERGKIEIHDKGVAPKTGKRTRISDGRVDDDLFGELPNETTDENDPVYMAALETIGLTINKKEVLKKFQKRFGNKVPITIDTIEAIRKMSGITDFDAWGTFYNAAVYLYEKAGIGADDHEAFHVALRLFTSRDQKTRLFTEAKERYGELTVSELSRLREEHPKMTPEGLVLMYYEEKMADEFMEYVQMDGQDIGQGFGQQIKEFFQSLWSWVKSLVNKDVSINELFEQIDKGAYRYRKVLGNTGFTEGTRANMRSPTMSPAEYSRRIEATNTMFSKRLDRFIENNPKYEGWNEIDVIRAEGKQFIPRLYQEVYDEIINLEERVEADGKLTGVKEQRFTNWLNEFVKGQNDKGQWEFGNLYYAAVDDLINWGIKVRFEQVHNVYDIADVEEIFDDDVLETEKQFESWQIKETQQNKKDNLSFKARKMLRNISLRDPNNPDRVLGDDLHVERVAKFHDLYNYLQPHLADLSGEMEMMEELKELIAFRPEIQGVIDKLNTNDDMRSQFVTNFTLEHVEHTMVQLKNRQISTFSSNRTGAHNILIDEWKENLNDKSRNQITDDDGEIDAEKVKDLVRAVSDKSHKDLSRAAGFDEYKKILKEKQVITPSDIKRLSEILIPFGIHLDVKTLSALYQPSRKPKLTAYANFRSTVLGKISLDTIINTLERGDNPFDEETSETAAVRKVARRISRMSKHLLQAGHMSIKNNAVWDYLLPRFMAKNINKFKGKNFKEAIHWYKDTPFYQDNVWLDYLLNNETDREEFEWKMIDGLRIPGQGLEYDDMTQQHFEVMNMGMFYGNQLRYRAGQYAFYHVPILGDAPTAIFVKFRKFDTEEENERIEIIEKFYKIAVQETKRIAQVKQDQESLNANELVENYHYKPGKFGKKDFAKARGIQYVVLPFLNNSKIDVIADKQATMQAIQEWLESELKIYREMLVDNKMATISEEEKLSSPLIDRRVNHDDFVKDYVYNSTFANIMLTQLFSGDLAFYKNSEDFVKRNKQIWSPGMEMNVLGRYVDRKGNLIQVRQHYRVNYLQDEILSTRHVANIRRALEKLNLPALQIKLIMAQYNANNHTDSQAYITLDRYREIMIGMGRWNHRFNDMFERLKKGEGTKQDLQIVMQPLKPFYFGHVKSIENSNTIVPVQNKNSEFVLIPQMVNKLPAGNNLRKLYDHMTAENIDAVNFATVVKVGKHNVISIDNLNTAETVNLSNSDYRIQQENPEHHIDADNLFGSQVSRLIIADIDPNTTYTLPSGEVTAKELTDLFQETIIQTAEAGLAKLKKSFKSPRTIRDMLLEEVRNRNLGPQFEEALALRNEEFTLPLFLPIHSRKNEQLLTSLFRKNVARQRNNGASMIQLSSFGYAEDLNIVWDRDGNFQYMEAMMPWWSKRYFKEMLDKDGFLDIKKIKDDSILKMIAYRIPTEHKYSILPIKVVGFTPQEAGGVVILPLELTTITNADFDVDKLYVMMPNFKVNYKKVEANQSQELLEVEFQEWVSTNLFVERPTVVRADLLQNNEDKARAEFAETKDLWWDENSEIFYEKGKLIGIERISYMDGKKIRPVDTMTKAQRENLIIDIGWAVLTNPAISPQILNPGGFKNLSNQSEESPGLKQRIQKLQGLISNYIDDIKSNPISVNDQVDLFKRVNTGKKMIPMFAIHKANHALLQLTEVEFADTINFDGNELKSLHQKTDVDGQLVSRNLASGLAASVDNLNDPTLGSLNLNQYTIDVLASILRVGYSWNTAEAFISQPAIVYLANRMESQRGIATDDQTIKQYMKEVLASIDEKNKIKLDKDEAPNINTNDLFDAIERGAPGNLSKLSDEQKQKHILSQLVVLKAFQQYYTQGQVLNRLVASTRPDSRSPWPTISAMEAFMTNRKSIQDSGLFENIETLQENNGQVNYIDRITDLSVGSAMDILGEYFPWSHQAFQDVKDTIRLGKRGQRLSAKQLEHINYHLITYLSSGYSFFNKEKAKNIVKATPAKLQAYMNNNLKSPYREFLIHLKVRSPNKKGQPIERITFSNTGQLKQEEKAHYTELWEQMILKGTEEEKTLANDLVLYTYFTSGFAFTPNSFGHMVPVEFFKQLHDGDSSFSQYLFNILEESKSEDNLYDDFVDQFYRNNYNRADFNPRVVSKVNATITKKVGKIPVEIKVDAFTQESFIVDIDENNNPIFAPSISYISGNQTYLYKLYRQDNKKATYTITSKLGLHNYVIEYDRTDPTSKSIFEFNEHAYTPKEDPNEAPVINPATYVDEAKETIIDEPQDHSADLTVEKMIDQSAGTVGINVDLEWEDYNDDIDDIQAIDDPSGFFQLDNELIYDYDVLFNYLKNSPGISIRHGNLYIIGVKYPLAIKTIAEINKMSLGLVKSKPTTVKGELGRTIQTVVINTEILNRNRKLRQGIQTSLFQISSKAKKQVNDGLNKMLASWLSNFGITIDQLDDFEEGRGLTPKAVADITNRMILINKGKEDANTMPEEASHFALELLGDDHVLSQRMMELAEGSKKHDQVKRDYAERYNNDQQKILKETAGQILSDVISEQYADDHSSALQRIAKKIWNWVLDHFRSNNSIEFRNQVKEIYGEVAEKILAENLTDFSESNLEKSGITSLEQIDIGGTDLNSIRNIIEKTIFVTQNKIEAHKEKGTTKFIQREKDTIKKLEKGLQEGKEAQTLIGFIENVRTEMRWIIGGETKDKGKFVGKLGILRHELTTNKNLDPNIIAKMLGDVHSYVSAYKPIVAMVRSNLGERRLAGVESQDNLESIKQAVDEIIEGIDLIEDQYYNIGLPTFAAGIIPALGEREGKGYGPKFNKTLQEELRRSDKDIGFFTRWLSAMAESTDSAQRAIDKFVKMAKEPARRAAYSVQKKIITLQHNMEKAEIKSTSWMAERNFNGKVTGNFLSKYNIGEFRKQKDLFAAKMRSKYKIVDNHPDKLSTKEQLIQSNPINYKGQYNRYKREWRTWYKENTDQIQGAELRKVLESKKETFIKKFGPHEGLDMYETWVEHNTYVSRSSHKRYGTNELMKPSEKFLNKDYSDLMQTTTNPAKLLQQEYYKYVIQLKKQFDSYFPEKFRDEFLMPQIRKDFIERAKNIKSKKDASRILEILREQFMLTEDETEIGRKSSLALDENGNPMNFLPIYYTTKLENADDLSLDITALMSNFAHMAENYRHMNRIIDLLELGKNILDHREISLSDYKGNPIKQFYEKTENIISKYITKESRGTYTYQRTQDYYDMVIYGKMRLSGKSLFKGSQIDREKAIDFFGRYVAVNALALNIYAGLQNPVYGNAMIRMEAMAKEFITNEDLLWGGVRYATELPKTLSEIGKHYQTGKLQGWMEHMDVLQDFRTNTISLDTNRKTIFGKMFNFGSLFFINHAGEHYMQGRLSLALAHNNRVTDQGVMDFRTYLKNDEKYMELENKRRELLVKSKKRITEKIEGKQLVHEADQVKGEQSKRHTELKKEFYANTSLWDAFEMDGNKMVLKKEFEKRISENDITKFILKQHFLNKRLHGIYNEIDRAAIQRFAVGRLAIMFRKFMRPGYNRRFQELTYNEESEAFTEGIYRTSWNFLSQLRKDMFKGVYLAKANWGLLSNTEKANFIRTLTEVAYMVGAALLSRMLQGIGDDDDNWTMNMLAYQSNRLLTELRFYSSIREMLKIAKSPAAAINQWEKMGTLLDTMTSIRGWTDRLQSGKYEGMTKVNRAFMEVAPLAKTFSDYMHPADKLMYFTGTNF